MTPHTSCFGIKPLRVQRISEVRRSALHFTEVDHQVLLERIIRSPIEACSHRGSKFVSSPIHAFVGAIHGAFQYHRPLFLSPDMFWLLILQGFAGQVKNEPERFRDFFVNHQGKAEIKVTLDSFIKGSPDNPWPEAFEEFSEALKNEIGVGNYSKIMAKFSTTGPIEKAAFEVTLMDAMQPFFEYTGETECGIPEIWFEGEADDWKLLKEKTQMLGESYGLESWTQVIIPHLERIHHNASGHEDPDLWRNIYKIDEESGGPFLNGWILDFFPSLQEEKPEMVYDRPGTHIDDLLAAAGFVSGVEEPSVRDESKSGKARKRVKTSDLPLGLSSAPMKWKYIGQVFNMEFIAGFTSIAQDIDTLALRPNIGWAVREVPADS